MSVCEAYQLGIIRYKTEINQHLLLINEISCVREMNW